MTEKPPGKKSIPHTWNAVSVVRKPSSCEAAHLLGNSRFLSREAPRLPLAACPIPDQCPCTYRHHSDRRANPRREEEKGGPRRPKAPERRVGRGRRSIDF